MGRVQVGTQKPKPTETTMTEEELIADCKKAMLDSRFPSVHPTTITVLADDDTVLHESVHGLVFKNYSVSDEEIHVYDEDIDTINLMATAISDNSESTIVLSVERENIVRKTTYVTPSFVVNETNNIHCLRGHLSTIHTVIDETEE